MLRNWVIGVTCAAFLIAAADCITPSGAVKKLGRLTGGLVLLLAMISPLMGLDYETLSIAMTESRGTLSGYSQTDADKLSADLMKTIIAEQTGAYILDKATVLGAQCAVQVDCSVSKDNIPYPAAVTVVGTLSDSQRRALSQAIEADLAIPLAMQTFESGDVE
ncbi:hypothetical protein SDC9_149406 [bioreactor metagenome]|uniref:Stage III sporulation protein AF n=1 Tax=bioreactor metagenome TaxID=1076179 RepID=A0A645ELN6_9ZZZZ